MGVISRKLLKIAESDQYIQFLGEMNKYSRQVTQIKKRIDANGYYQLSILREGVKRLKQILYILEDMYNRKYFGINIKSRQRKMFHKLRIQLVEFIRYIKDFLQNVHRYYIEYCQQRYKKEMGNIII